MPTITWLGTGDDGPDEAEGFRGMKFKKGEPVECDDPDTLARASGNKYYKVEGVTAADKPPEPEPLYDVTREASIKPPSQQTAQFPVPKHGDTKTLEASIPNPPDPKH